MDIINFFKSLSPDDWTKKITDRWTVKDVLSHLVGWEREVAIELKNTFENGKEAWFMRTDDYAEFNDKIYKEFKNNSPEKLLAEIERWQKITEKEIGDIGEDRIRQRDNMSWVFDEGDSSHFKHHINQVKKVLGRMN